MKSFGGIKGLLTFADIKAHGKTKEFKQGGMVKAYVLFRKKDKGMALTLDKAKAKELRKEWEVKETAEEGGSSEKKITSLEQQFPNQDQIAELKEKYKSLIAISQDRQNIGKTFQFRVMETSENYFIVKSIDAEKKSKNIVATLPKALVGKFFLNTLTLEDQIFEGIVLDIQDDALPIVSVQHDLLSLKEHIPKDQDDISNFESLVGLISSVDRRGVTLRFLNGIKKLVLVKDLETVQDFLTIYKVGKVVRAAKNKLDRLTLKQSVIYHQHRGAENEQKDREALITGLYNQMKAQHA